MPAIVFFREANGLFDGVPGLSSSRTTLDKELLIALENVEQLILPSQLLSEDGFIVIDEMFQFHRTAPFAVGSQEDLPMSLDVASLHSVKKSRKDRLEHFEVATVDDHFSRDSLIGLLPFRNNLVRETECLRDRSPARFGLCQFLENTSVLLIELVERMILVLLWISLPPPCWGKLPETESLHLKDKQAMEWVKNQEVALAADVPIVQIIKPPPYRPTFTETAEFVRDLDLRSVTFLRGAIVKPAGHSLE